MPASPRRPTTTTPGRLLASIGFMIVFPSLILTVLARLSASPLGSEVNSLLMFAGALAAGLPFFIGAGMIWGLLHAVQATHPLAATGVGLLAGFLAAPAYQRFTFSLPTWIDYATCLWFGAVTGFLVWLIVYGRRTA